MVAKIPGSSYLRINDIQFEVPPERITIVKRDFSDQVATLRSQTSTIIKSGRRMISYVVDLYFATGYNALTGDQKQLNSWINQQLSPLLIQIRKCPFVSIENEKLRKELFGEGQSTDNRNMAAIVKNIAMSVEVRQSELLKVSITFQSFNHHPYTPDFNFKEITPSGTIISKSTPGAPFTKFYSAGTVDDQGRFVNALGSAKGSGVRFIYKQYYELDFDVQNLQDIIAASSDKEEFELEQVQSVFDAGVASVDQKVKLLEKLGFHEEKGLTSTKKNAKLLYRYKIFDISESVALESDALIVEAGTAYVETKTPNIPLMAHAIPTSQFLGCADARLTFQIFANAQLVNNKPIGTSRELSKLNRMIEVVSQNALKHHRQSFNDSIFLRHPLAKLCKYKSYTNTDKTRYRAFNGVTGKLETFDPNEYLACHVEDTSSATVEGHPYCSRFVMNLVENYRNEESEKRLKKDGSSNKVYEATKTTLKVLSARYGIVRSEGGKGPFVTTDRPIGEFPQETAIANKLVASLNTTLSLRTLAFPGKLPRFFDTSAIKSVDDIIDNKELVENTTSDYRSSLFQSEINPDQNPPPLSSNRLTEIADDLILLASESNSGRLADYQESMSFFETYNLVPNDSAYPDMMLPPNETQPDFPWYNLSDELNTQEERDKLATEIFKDRIDIGTAHASSFQSPLLPENLKSQEFQVSQWVPALATNLLSTGQTAPNSIESDKPFAQAPLDPIQQKFGIQKSVETFNDNTYTMRRSMPTFKLYLKDDLPEDSPGTFEGGTWRNFSDLYDINSLIDIRLAKDEANPVDILIIRMTNSRQDILNNYYKVDKKDLSDVTEIKRLTQKATSPERLKNSLKTLENKQLDGVILREGTRVELRLGYEDNPNNLSVEFVGRVMSASGADVIEIVCQGDGVELVQELKGVGQTDTYSYNSETSKMISELLEISPEVASFGTTGASTALGSINAIWKGFGGRSAAENIFAPTLYNSWDKIGEKTISYTQWGAMIGTIVPGLGTLIGLKLGAAAGAAVDLYTAAKTFLNGVPFVIYEQTIWDVFQELTLRHPGTICAVVPFDERSTIFFGYPEQLYFYRGSTYAEKIRYNRANSGLSIINKTRRDALNSKLSPFLSVFGDTSIDREDAKKIQDAAEANKTEINPKSMRPFRTYHVVTAEHDIVMNEMMVTSENVYNSIEIVHPVTSDDANSDGSKGFSSYEKTDTILADDDIYKNYIKKQTLVFHNATSDPLEDLPNKYAMASLGKSLEGAYSGKITILGRPGVKPHDVVFIEDNYNEVYGPVKVGRVVQVFSYQSGWVTEIHPRMIVGVAGTVTVDQVAAMKYAAKRFALRNFQIFESGFQIDEADLDDKSILTRFTEAAPGQLKEGLETASYVGLTSLGIVATKKAFTGSTDAAKAAFKAGTQAGSKIAGATGAGGVFLKAAGKSIKIPLLGFALDYAVSSYISWSKTRQPIAFLPVHRRGVPWYTGLYGLKNNTEIQAAEKLIRDKAEEFTYLYDSVIDRISGDR